MFGKFSLGFSNSLYAKENYLFEKSDLEVLVRCGEALSLNNADRFVRDVKVLINNLKKYIQYLYENKSEEERLNEVFKVLMVRAKIQRYAIDNKTGLKDISKIEQGEKLTVAIPGNKYFKSVMGEKTKDYFVCSYPLEDPNLLEIQWKNLKTRVFFSKKSDAQYLFDSVILEAYGKGSHGILRIKNPSKILKKQRREFPRIECLIQAATFPVTILEKGKSWRVKIDENRKYYAEIRNISAGGFALLTDAIFETDEFIKVDFTLFDKNETVLAQVIRFSHEEKIGRNMVGLKIIKIQPSTKVAILLYTFDYFPGKSIEQDRKDVVATEAEAIE